jgi:hypothetical protein
MKVSTVIEAIDKNQKSFNEKKILYLSTEIKYQNRMVSIHNILSRGDYQYVKWYIGKHDCYVSDEVSKSCL